MKAEKAVSVIIPVYNAQAHLEQCVRSVMNQTLKEIEIICVDDGSKDDSLAILRRLAQEDARILVMAQENAGAGAARNRGLDAAKGRYLSFLDADDFFEPDMLETAYRKAEQEQAQVLVFRADFYDDQIKRFLPCTYSLREEMLPADRPYSAVQIERDLFKTVVGWAWDKLFETAYIRECGLRFQEQRTTNDAYFVFMAYARAERISTVSRVLAHQRRHAGGTLSVTREKSWMCFYEALLAMRKTLTAWGLYERFERDYVNYALHFSLWNLNTLKGPTQRMLYDRLRDEWFQELGITGYACEGFYHRGEYAQYEETMRRPYHEGRMKLNKAKARLRTYIGHAIRLLIRKR